MKNIIFISPNFPANYWLFCRELRANGMNVLGIGDERYERLSQGLRENLTEYYKVYISRAVADALGDRAEPTSLGKAELKGKREGFEILALDALY